MVWKKTNKSFFDSVKMFATRDDGKRKTCFQNMQQIYRGTPVSKCDFNKVAKVGGMGVLL